MGTRAGKFDRRVVIQLDKSRITPPPSDTAENAFGGAEDAFGGDVEAFSDVGTVWAAIDYGNGIERRSGVAQEQASFPATVTVRRSELTSRIGAETHRLQFDGRTWDIESVPPGQGRGSDIVIIARARV